MLKEIVAYDNQLYPNHRHLAAFSYRTRFNQVSIIGLSISLLKILICKRLFTLILDQVISYLKQDQKY